MASTPNSSISRVRIDHVPLRFGHLAGRRPAASRGRTPSWGRGKPSRHQDARPDDRVEAQNVFAHHVDVGGPPLGELAVILQVADACEVVGQRVDPDVHDVLLVEGNGNAPIERGAGDAQLFQPALDEADHLVAPGVRLDELRVLLDVGQQPVGVPGDAEEVALLLQPLQFPAAVGAAARPSKRDSGQKVSHGVQYQPS